MLLPEQAIPFLSNDDPILRDHACSYFRDANDIGALTAEGCWAAIQKVGLGREEVNLVNLLQFLPQSDESTRQLLAALESTSDRNVQHELFEALSEIEFEQLRRHRETIMAIAELPDSTRNDLQMRLDLGEQSAEALWKQFEEMAATPDDDLWDALESGRFEHLLDALARLGQTAADRAMAIISDPAKKDSLEENLAIGLLGRLRYRPALELLTARFLQIEPEDDFLFEDFEDALPRIGGVDLISPMEEHFGELPWELQITIAEFFARINHPASEAALLRMIDLPEIDEAHDHMLRALTKICTTDGLPKLREIVLNNDYDAKNFDIKGGLVACALMSGFEFPELAAMREEVVARRAEDRRRLETAAKIFDWNDEAGDDDFGDEEFEDEGMEFLPPPPPRPAPVETIVNKTPKVGRNDPCPCGSGKKYKKCCLDKN
jgi:SEC-C motif-containing protein